MESREGSLSKIQGWQLYGHTFAVIFLKKGDPRSIYERNSAMTGQDGMAAVISRLDSLENEDVW